MGFVRALCPNCGANLSVDDHASSARCEYCGTTSSFQRRTRVLQRRVPVTATNAPIAVQRISRTAIIVPALLAGGLLAFSTIMISRGAARRHTAQPATTTAVPARPKLVWNGGAAIPHDVDGDGVHDLIGFSHYAYKDTHLVAYSGVDGAVLWKSDRLAARDELNGTPLAIAGETLLWADRRAHLHAFDVRTGKPRWEVELAEQVQRLCATDPDRVTLRTKDERWLLLSLADGTHAEASPLAPPPDGMRTKSALPPCIALPTNQDRRIDGATIDPYTWSGNGMWIGYRLVADGRRIAVGHRDPGSYIPMVAAVDDKDGMVWTLDVPETDPMTAHTGAPALAALTGTLLVVVHQHAKQRIVTAVDASTGTRRWSSPMSALPVGSSLDGLTLTPSLIVVSSDANLQTFDLSGRPKFTIGS